MGSPIWAIRVYSGVILATVILFVSVYVMEIGSKRYWAKQNAMQVIRGMAIFLSPEGLTEIREQLQMAQAKESRLKNIARWLGKTAERHRVNPLIFGVLYFGTIPTYIYGIARFIANYKAGWGESALWFSVGFVSFLAPYVYILIWGRNLSRRFWFFLGGWITVAAVLAAVKIIRQLA